MSLELPNWIGITSIVLYMLTFYFVLSFIESIHKDDQRVVRQSKIAAMVCLALALLLPALYSFMYF